MTATKTKIAIASLFAISFASSAFASDVVSRSDVQDIPQPAQQQRYVQTGANAYAQAPAQRNAAFSDAERREFDRATAAALSQ